MFPCDVKLAGGANAAGTAGIDDVPFAADDPGTGSGVVSGVVKNDFAGAGGFGDVVDGDVGGIIGDGTDVEEAESTGVERI